MEREIVLTRRQREIVGLIALGHTNEAIADMLGLSGSTVRAHCNALRLKLGVASRRQLPAASRAKTGFDPFALV